MAPGNKPQENKPAAAQAPAANKPAAAPQAQANAAPAGDAAKPQAKPVEMGAGDYYLRVKLKHPNRRYRLQGHVVTDKIEKFTLTAKEVKELQMPGARDWIEICTEKQMKADQKLRDQIAKPFDDKE